MCFRTSKIRSVFGLRYIVLTLYGYISNRREYLGKIEIRSSENIVIELEKRRRVENMI